MNQEAPDALFARALQHHGNSQLDLAETLYRQALQQQPDFPECQHKLALCVFTQGQHSEAVEMFEQLVARNPANTQYWTSYIHALLLTKSIAAAEAAYHTALEQGANREALVTAEQLILNTRHGGALKKLGSLLEQGRHAEVKEDSATLLVDCPNLGLGWKMRAIALQSMEDVDTEQALNNAIRLLPKDFELLNNLGVWLRARGRLEEAETCYRQAIALNNHYADAHGNLANLLVQTSRPEQAEQEYRQAINANPAHIEARNNLANLLIAREQHSDALAQLESVLQSHPDKPEVLNNLGVVLSKLDRSEQASEAFSRAIRLWPDYAEAHANLGQVLARQQLIEEAEQEFGLALALRPDWIETLNDLGNLLAENGREEEAEACFEKALQSNPEHVMTLCNYGNFQVQMGSYNSAREKLARAIQLDPEFVDAHYNLGVLEADSNHLERAIVAYRNAIQLDGKLHKAHNNLAMALKDRGRYEEAQQHITAALELAPDNGEYHNNQGVLLLEVGRLEEAEKAFRAALAIDPGHHSAHSNLLFGMNYRPDLTAQDYMAEASKFDTAVVKHAQSSASWANEKSNDRVLRVGIVSADLYRHPVGYFAAEVMRSLSAQFGDSIQLHVFANQLRMDDLSARIKDSCSSWTGIVHLNDSEVVKQIRRRQIDILIDLSGHTAHNRLPVFARKPAPVSLSWLGYYASTGLKAIDYFIADKHTVPQDSKESFSEQIVRLPDTRICYSIPEYDCQVSELPCDQGALFTFASFNNLPKINEDVISVWSTVLQRVPDSRLLLKAKQYDSEEIRARLKGAFIDKGIPSDRILLEGPSTREEYFRRFHHVDLCLDPFPFPGGTTTGDSLWMGVPVVTLAGQRLITRQGLGILRVCGLDEFIAEDVNDYIELAVNFAANRELLGQLRGELRNRVLNSPLFDTDAFSKKFHSALRALWREWCEE